MEPISLGLGFERFREYLRAFARDKIDARHHGRLDPSGLVQDTLLQAWRSRNSLSANDEASVKAWLRTILSHRISNAIRDAARKKRGAGRVVSLDANTGDSTHALVGLVASPGPSPSSILDGRDLAAHATAALQGLPEAQRIALTLRFWQGCSLSDIAARMQRSEGAVSLLLHRGLRKLKEVLHSLR